MQSVGLSDELSVFLRDPLAMPPPQSIATPSRPTSAPPPHTAGRSAASIQLRRAAELDSSDASRDHGDAAAAASMPSGSGDSDPMPSSPSSADANPVPQLDAAGSTPPTCRLCAAAVRTWVG